jgi:hypothetical protein
VIFDEVSHSCEFQPAKKSTAVNHTMPTTFPDDASRSLGT